MSGLDSKVTVTLERPWPEDNSLHPKQKLVIELSDPKEDFKNVFAAIDATWIGIQGGLEDKKAAKGARPKTESKVTLL